VAGLAPGAGCRARSTGCSARGASRSARGADCRNPAGVRERDSRDDGRGTPASRNVIAGNDLSAIGMYYGSNSNKVQNNYLGVGATGMSLPNGKSGVLLIACNNTSISSNTIACCGTSKPVQINSGSGTTQTANSLYAKVTAGLRIV